MTRCLEGGDMRKAVVCFFIAIAFTGFSGSVYACTCAGGLSLEQHFKGADAVFVGEVTEVKHNVNRIQIDGKEYIGLGTIEVTFKVTRVAKGGMKVNDSVTVRTPDQGPACGIEGWSQEKPGVSWVVYADTGDSFLGLVTSIPKDMFVTSHCDRTSRTANADADLKYFDSLKR